jgi:hypothetical protein
MRLKHGVDFIPPEYLLILNALLQLASAQRQSLRQCGVIHEQHP